MLWMVINGTIVCIYWNTIIIRKWETGKWNKWKVKRTTCRKLEICTWEFSNVCVSVSEYTHSYICICLLWKIWSFESQKPNVWTWSVHVNRIWVCLLIFSIDCKYKNVRQIVFNVKRTYWLHIYICVYVQFDARMWAYGDITLKHRFLHDHQS